MCVCDTVSINVCVGVMLCVHLKKSLIICVSLHDKSNDINFIIMVLVELQLFKLRLKSEMNEV